MEPMSIDTRRPKNVPEELKSFLEANSNEWFTNDQLAGKLGHTPSGIRNAVTKLKNTGLIKTRMVGTLAYRGWHTAPEMQECLLSPEAPKRGSTSGRRCNGCATTVSKYWRSDLEHANEWLCNNCGMNQRRGRGIPRIGQLMNFSLGKIAVTRGITEANVPPIPSFALAPSAEPNGNMTMQTDEAAVSNNPLHTIPDFDDTDASSAAGTPTSTDVVRIDSATTVTPRSTAGKRSHEETDDEWSPFAGTSETAKRFCTQSAKTTPGAAFIPPSQRICAHCHASHSAGKWRRDKEMPERYLCNKCGMSQRRASLKLQKQVGYSSVRNHLPTPNTPTPKRPRKEPIQSTSHSKPLTIKLSVKSPACTLCGEMIPTMGVDACHHRICGECIPGLIRSALMEEEIDCPACTKLKLACPAYTASTISISRLGMFVDNQIEMDTL